MEPFQPRSGSGGRSDATGARRRPAAISQLRAAAVAAALGGPASVRMAAYVAGTGPDGQGDRRRRSFVLPILSAGTIHLDSRLLQPHSDARPTKTDRLLTRRE
jgi:hypothetical protein